MTKRILLSLVLAIGTTSPPITLGDDPAAPPLPPGFHGVLPDRPLPAGPTALVPAAPFQPAAASEAPAYCPGSSGRIFLHVHGDGQTIVTTSAQEQPEQGIMIACRQLTLRPNADKDDWIAECRGEVLLCHPQRSRNALPACELSAEALQLFRGRDKDGDPTIRVLASAKDGDRVRLKYDKAALAAQRIWLDLENAAVRAEGCDVLLPMLVPEAD